MPELKKPRHLADLLARINALAETMELDEANAERLRVFVSVESLAQYQAGNRDAMRWMRTGRSTIDRNAGHLAD